MSRTSVSESIFAFAQICTSGKQNKAAIAKIHASSRSLFRHAPKRSSSTAMLDAKGSRTRRERTLIGSECAACEEPLEHTLRGERILQLSCGHVSHEACFYEYIREFESQECPTCNAPLGLDTSRGGNLDFEKLNNLVKSVQNTETGVRARDTQKAPTPFDTHTIRTGKSVEPPHRQSHSHRDGRSHARGEHEGHHGHDERSDRHTVASTKAHVRNDSGTIGVESAGDYASHQTNGRRHDYDVQSMETSLSNSRLNATKNPIPAPSVTVRSEFPTLNRSRQQQSLTCMITVEVVDGKWRADPADFRGPPSAASTLQPEEHCERPKSPAPSRQREAGLASVEDLRRITGDLHDRVDNWHGLDFKR
ncbi:hypothetical protein LTR66_007644 [Elasticomyces elasticus]|nr:hypothetical protein LTR66_007644 [Elasticomyces elasticus]KAK4987871.1 hypothetical protein LTR50_004323 [Elasticomyces elasticus]